MSIQTSRFEPGPILPQTTLGRVWRHSGCDDWGEASPTSPGRRPQTPDMLCTQHGPRRRMARREAPLCKGRDALPGGGGFGLQRRGRPPCPCTWACTGLYSPPAIPRLDTRPAWKLSHPSSKATGCPGRPSGGRAGCGGFLVFPWDRDLTTPHPSPAEHTHPLPHAQARTQVHTCQHTTRVPACSDAVRTRSLAPRAAPASCRRPRPAASGLQDRNQPDPGVGWNPARPLPPRVCPAPALPRAPAVHALCPRSPPAPTASNRVLFIPDIVAHILAEPLWHSAAEVARGRMRTAGAGADSPDPAAFIAQGEPHAATSRNASKLTLLDLLVAILFKASFLITSALRGICAHGDGSIIKGSPDGPGFLQLTLHPTAGPGQSCSRAGGTSVVRGHVSHPRLLPKSGQCVLSLNPCSSCSGTVLASSLLRTTP